MPRFDSGSCFGRLLDYQIGGYCSVLANVEFSTRAYVEQTLVLRTSFRTASGAFDLFDFFSICVGGATAPKHQLVRVIECTSGQVDVCLQVQPRFDYGLLPPWLRQEGVNCFSAIGGNNALVIDFEGPLVRDGESGLSSNITLHAGQQAHLSIRYVDASRIDRKQLEAFDFDELKLALPQTIRWWQDRSACVTYAGKDKNSITTSALVLKGLCYAPTGAIIAAPTTSLPEVIGGSRNWDYRYSWIRDSVFSARALAEIGFLKEASRFRDFVQRSAASSADLLLIMYGIDGRRRLDELELPELSGYKESRPVRFGNAAFKQKQFDCYGLLLQLVWHWHLRGKSPDDDLWRFIVRLVDFVCDNWERPDQGLWESRGMPQHFVHSKIMLWCAVDRGIKLANDCARKAPIRKWETTRRSIKSAIEAKGIDRKGHYFVQSFGSSAVDSASLLIPQTEFVEWQDKRMVATCDEIMEQLDRDGLLLRYASKSSSDGLTGKEGSFLACTFWLVECLAMQGRMQLAREYFDRALACSNDLGLFSEEFDVKHQEALGNFPQGLSHLSHIAAATALETASSKLK
jgi:GH15 family glucan-1,4-alpha-glucosidase